MSVTVKICGITSVEDARAAVEAGADAIGLMFYPPSPRAVSVELAREISAVLPQHIVRVGVFVDPSEELVLSALAHCGLTILQFHGNETPEFCRQFSTMTIKAFRIKDAASLEPLSAYRTDAWLLDSYVAGQQGGTGAMFNWDLACQVVRYGKPVFLAGGLTPENVGEAVAKVRPFGVDVSSGVESSPGKKDPARMTAFVRAAKSAWETF